MDSISDRQKQLLAAIIQEFMETAEAVGSIDLADRYDFHLSPATIRNEMADLVKMGYLYKTHSSAGRTPTSMAWRLYLAEFLDEVGMEPVKEAEIKERIFQTRFSADRLIKEAVTAIAEFTKYPAIAIVDETSYYAGLANLMRYAEFKDYDTLEKLLLIIEDATILKKLFKSSRNESGVSVLIGEELGIQTLKNAAVVFTKINIRENYSSYLSVIGPSRMNYSKVLPALRYISESLTEATRGW